MRNLNLTFLFLWAVSASGQTPTVGASNIMFTFVGCNEFTAQWTNGNGDGRVVFIQEGAGVSDVPVLHNYYTGNPLYGVGESIKGDNKNFCVYNGSDNKITVKGLKKMTRYYIAVFEYNGTGGAIYYKTDTWPVKDTTTKNIVANGYLFYFLDTSTKEGDEWQCLNGNSFQFINKSTSDLSPMTYSWKFGDGDSSNLKEPKHTYKTAGIKLVTLIARAPGCYSSNSFTDTVYPHPIASFLLDPAVTKNDSIQCFYGNRFTFKNKTTWLDIGVGPSSARYEWYDEDSMFSNGYKSDRRFASPGIKRVKLVSVSNRGCRDSTFQMYKVLPRGIDPAKIIITPKSMYLKGNKFTFTNNNLNYPTPKWRLTSKTNKFFKDSLNTNPATYSFSTVGWYYIYFESTDTVKGCFESIKDSVEVKQDVGTIALNQPTISIYPNPSTSGLFNIDNLPGDGVIKVYSIIGEELSNINPRKSNDQINLSQFGAGTYILSLWSEGRKFDYRVTVL